MGCTVAQYWHVRGISVALVVPPGEIPQPLLICSVGPLGPLPVKEPGWWLDLYL